jgi:hypothetical protein
MGYGSTSFNVQSPTAAAALRPQVSHAWCGHDHAPIAFSCSSLYPLQVVYFKGRLLNRFSHLIGYRLWV